MIPRVGAPGIWLCCSLSGHRFAIPWFEVLDLLVRFPGWIHLSGDCERDRTPYRERSKTKVLREGRLTEDEHRPDKDRFSVYDELEALDASEFVVRMSYCASASEVSHVRRFDNCWCCLGGCDSGHRVFCDRLLHALDMPSLW